MSNDAKALHDALVSTHVESLRIASLQCVLGSMLSQINLVQDELDESGEILPVQVLHDLRASVHVVWKRVYDTNELLEEREDEVAGRWSELLSGVMGVPSDTEVSS